MNDVPSTQAIKSLSLTLIGCGKMGLSMLKGWMNISAIKAFHIIEPHPSPELLDAAAADNITLYNSLEAYCKAKHESAVKTSWDEDLADIAIMAVKPQMIHDILQDFIVQRDAYPECRHFDAVLSIAAGTLLSVYEVFFPSDVQLVRIMPNTPAAIGKGASVYYTHNNASENIAYITDALLRPLGHVYRVYDENDMHAVTAISGSGPAYLFALTESMTNAAIKLGIPGEMAASLARQTVIGAAALMESEAGTSATDLRKAVTSRGGTTQAALDILKSPAAPNLDSLMEAAMNNAKKRSIELASFEDFG